MYTTDELSVLADATRYLFNSLRLIRDIDLSAPTPCGDFDLQGLLRHVHMSLNQVTDVLAPQAFDADYRSDLSRETSTDSVSALRRDIVDLLLASTSLPTAGRWCDIWDRSLPADIVVYVAAIEMALHAWDITQACRADRPIPNDLASALLKISPPLAEAGLTEQLFAQPLRLSKEASPSDNLLALFGRQPVFHD